MQCIDCGIDRKVQMQFCNNRCRSCASRAFLPKLRAAHKAKRGRIDVVRYCITCKKNFTCKESILPRKTPLRTGKFCSHSCYLVSLHRPDRIKGRGLNWAKIRKEAKAREPFCACCATILNLETHHIVPYRIWPTNHPKNLISLCHKCHPLVERSFVEFERASEENPIKPEIMLCLWRLILLDRQNLARMFLQNQLRNLKSSNGQSLALSNMPIIRAIMTMPSNEWQKPSKGSVFEFPLSPLPMEKWWMATSGSKPRGRSASGQFQSFLRTT